MRFFSRSFSPKMRRLFLGAAVVGSCLGISVRENVNKQNEIEKMKKEFLLKEKNYQKEISRLKILANRFRFYEYDSFGAKLSDVNVIKNDKFDESTNPGKAFDRFYLKQINSTEVLSLAQKWQDERRKFSKNEVGEQNLLEEKLLSELENDSISAYRDEKFLKKIAMYRQIVLYKAARLSMKEKRYGLKVSALFDMKQNELKEQDADVRQIAKHEVYGANFPYENERWRLMNSILKTREFISFNNSMIEDIKLSYRQLFEAHKEVRLNELHNSIKKQANKNTIVDMIQKNDAFSKARLLCR